MAAPKPKKINLLTQEESSQFGKILAWLLTVGRIIVILVELVVICAFLSRFWLDRQLTDLVEKNNAKRAQVVAAASFEKDFRSTQMRLAAFSQLDKLKFTPSIYLQDAAVLLPAEVILSNISYTDGKFSFSGSSLNEAGLAGFIKALETSDKFAQVSLVNISLDRTNANFIKFIVKADQELKK